MFLPDSIFRWYFCYFLAILFTTKSKDCSVPEKCLSYCAKRSFHPCCTSNSDVRISFVRREIIDLCEGDEKAASLLLSTGGLST